MSKLKKIIITLAIICVVSTFMCISASAADITASGNCGANGDNLTWTLDSEGLLTISGTGKMEEYEYWLYAPWYKYNSSIKEVVVQEGVTNITHHAFYYYKNIVSVSLADSVTDIDDYAFLFCTSIESISFGSGLKSIGEQSFYSCTSLKILTIPNKVTSIGNYAFDECTSLCIVEFLGNAPSIGTSAFPKQFSTSGKSVLSYYSSKSGWSSPTWNGYYTSSADIPSDLSTLDSNYTNSQGIRFTLDFTNKTAIVGTNSTDSNNSGYSGQSVGRVVIPSTVSKDGESYTVIAIGKYAFNSDLIKSVNICSSVSTIGSAAFSQCTNMAEITLPSSLTKIDDSSFYKCSSLTNISLPDSLTYLGKRAFYYCSSLLTIDIPSSISYLRSDAFGYCSSLESAVIPSSITNIDVGVFEACSNLSSIYYGGNLNSWCNISFSDGVFSNGSDFYINNAKVTSIVIPTSITTVGKNIFQGCGSLENIVIGENITTIESSAFYGCSSLVSISLPNTIDKIPAYCFYGCASLSDITIPSNVTTIGAYAFRGCSSLKHINIPDNVTSIGYETFYNCTSLSELIIPEGVQSIGNYAFSNCKSLESLELPNSITTIWGNAFSYCSKLRSVIFGNNLSTIDSAAFSKCLSLKVIKFSGNAPSIDYDSFSGDTLTAYYPYNYSTWVNNSALNNYGGTINWLPFDGVIIDDCTAITGHSYSEYVSNNDATCTKDGTKTATCANCGKTDTITDEGSAGHTLVSVAAKSQTCSESGWDAYEYCTRCDYTTYCEIPPHFPSDCSFVFDSSSNTWNEEFTCENCSQKIINSNSNSITIRGSENSKIIITLSSDKNTITIQNNMSDVKIVAVAKFDGNGKFVGIAMAESTVNISDASSIKVIFLNDAYTPLFSAVSAIR